MKVANTYWDNNLISPKTTETTRRAKVRSEKTRSNATPQWFIFTVIASLTFLLCIVVNIRAYVDYQAESLQHQTISSEIEQLTSLNAGLQQEINNLQNDERTIEREARTRLGMVRQNERIILSYK